MRRSIAVLLPLALAACNADDAAPASIDAQPVDAQPVDAPAPSLIGSWRELPNAASSDPKTAAELELWAFNADATFAMDADPFHTRGTYTLTGDELSIITGLASDPYIYVTPFRVTATHLVLGVMTPVGTPTGVVGTWTGRTVTDGVGLTLTITLAADHTLEYIADSDDPDFDLNRRGTWRAVGDDLELLVALSQSSSYNLFVTHHDGVLGELLERL